MVNADESFWRCEEYHMKTWAPVNSQSILLHTNGSEKAGFTAVATVSLSGEKYPLILIGKGTSIKVENNWFGSGRSLNSRIPAEPEALPNPFHGMSASRKSSVEKVVPNSLTDHSKKGWITVET